MNKFPIAINNFSFILFGYKKSWFNNIEGDGSNPIPNPFRPMSPALPSTPSNSGSAFAVHACRVYARWPLLLLIFHSPSLYSNHNYYSHNHWNDESKRHMLVAHSGCQPKKQPPLFNIIRMRTWIGIEMGTPGRENKYSEFSFWLLTDDRFQYRSIYFIDKLSVMEMWWIDIDLIFHIIGWKAFVFSHLKL